MAQEFLFASLPKRLVLPEGECTALWAAAARRAFGGQFEIEVIAGFYWKEGDQVHLMMELEHATGVVANAEVLSRREVGRTPFGVGVEHVRYAYRLHVTHIAQQRAITRA
jgi:hypothetical protein